MTFEEMQADASADTLYIWSEGGADLGIGTPADAAMLKADGLITDQTVFRRA